MNISLYISLISILFLISAEVSQAEQFANPKRFWSQFRQYVLDDKLDELNKLTRFPFEVRGPDDSDPVIHYDKKNFKKVFVKLILQQAILPSKGSVISKSMLQVVKDKKELVDTDFAGDNEFDVELFVFSKINNYWYFTRSYLEE